MHSLIWANIQDKHFFIRLCVKLKKICPNERFENLDAIHVSCSEVSNVSKLNTFVPRFW